MEDRKMKEMNEWMNEWKKGGKKRKYEARGSGWHDYRLSLMRSAKLKDIDCSNRSEVKAEYRIRMKDRLEERKSSDTVACRKEKVSHYRRRNALFQRARSLKRIVVESMQNQESSSKVQESMQLFVSPQQLSVI